MSYGDVLINEYCVKIEYENARNKMDFMMLKELLLCDFLYEKRFFFCKITLILYKPFCINYKTILFSNTIKYYMYWYYFLLRKCDSKISCSESITNFY